MFQVVWVRECLRAVLALEHELFQRVDYKVMQFLWGDKLLSALWAAVNLERIIFRDAIFTEESSAIPALFHVEFDDAKTD